jgi:hypothetical protein
MVDGDEIPPKKQYIAIVTTRKDIKIAVKNCYKAFTGAGKP